MVTSYNQPPFYIGHCLSLVFNGMPVNVTTVLPQLASIKVWFKSSKWIWQMTAIINVISHLVLVWWRGRAKSMWILPRRPEYRTRSVGYPTTDQPREPILLFQPLRRSSSENPATWPTGSAAARGSCNSTSQTSSTRRFKTPSRSFSGSLGIPNQNKKTVLRNRSYHQEGEKSSSL